MPIKFLITILSLSSGYFYFTSPRNEVQKFQSNYTLKVQLLNSEVTINPGIGKNWSFHSNIDDNEVMKGETYTISLNGKTQVDIISTAIEDDKYDDIGVDKLIITPSNLKDMVAKSEVKSIVKVYEGHGRGAGKTATCEFIYQIRLDSTISNMAGN